MKREEITEIERITGALEILFGELKDAKDYLENKGRPTEITEKLYQAGCTLARTLDHLDDALNLAEKAWEEALEEKA